MLYPKENKVDNTLMFACRTCPFSEVATSSCVFRNELTNTVGATAGITQDVGTDPTVSTFDSNNASCGSVDSGYQGSGHDAQKAGEDEGVMYLCTICGQLIICEYCGMSCEGDFCLEVQDRKWKREKFKMSRSGVAAQAKSGPEGKVDCSSSYGLDTSKLVLITTLSFEPRQL